MNYLLDTNVLSQQDLSPKVRNWVMQHYLMVAVSTISVAELAQGIHALPPGPKRAKYEAQLHSLMQEYPLLDFGVKEARSWGQYINQVGRPVPLMDSLISAVALANGLQVVTENEKDFPGVPTVNPLKL